jgi:cupin fold WbuC family metalloprotein
MALTDANISMKNSVTIVTVGMLEGLGETAKTLPRRRKNFNIHTDLNDPVQRLYNAMEPSTYVRPHRHQGGDRWEFFQIVSGKALVLTFNEKGVVLERFELCSTGPNFALEIPGDTWHTVVSLQSGTVLFEVKQGPYRAVTDKDFAAWAPLEGEPSAHDFVHWLAGAKPGNGWSQ